VRLSPRVRNAGSFFRSYSTRGSSNIKKGFSHHEFSRSPETFTIDLDRVRQECENPANWEINEQYRTTNFSAIDNRG
jgi:hypothetical protein